MTFIQNQEITMPENVGYITELIANYCYNGLSNKEKPTLIVFVATLYWGQMVWICSRLVLYLTLMLWTFIVRHGDVLTVIGVRHFRL